MDLVRMLEHHARVVVDQRDNEPWGSIKEFEERIRNEDLVVCVITGQYLRSQHSTYELTRLMKDENWRKKTMFIIYDNNVDIFSASGKLEYIKYWYEQERLLNEKLMDFTQEFYDSASAMKLRDALLEIRVIKDNMDGFLDALSDTNNPPPDDVVKKIIVKCKENRRL